MSIINNKCDTDYQNYENFIISIGNYYTLNVQVSRMFKYRYKRWGIFLVDYYYVNKI